MSSPLIGAVVVRARSSWASPANLTGLTRVSPVPLAFKHIIESGGTRQFAAMPGRGSGVRNYPQHRSIVVPPVRRGDDKARAAERSITEVVMSRQVIGTGTPGSCTSAAVVGAVAKGGIIAFDCGPRPVTIALTAPAKVVNTAHQIVLD